MQQDALVNPALTRLPNPVGKILQPNRLVDLFTGLLLVDEWIISRLVHTR